MSRQTKTIFWNVDTQRDFMEKNGALYVPNAESIVNNLELITNFASNNNIKVINTADNHPLYSSEFSDKPDFINTFPPHCVVGTSGAEYINATNPKNPYVCNWNGNYSKEEVIRKRNIIITKDDLDVFIGNPHTDSVINTINPTDVIVYGVATNYCVDFSVRDLKELGLNVNVLSDAIKEIPAKEEPQKTFEKWEQLGIELITTKEFINSYKNNVHLSDYSLNSFVRK